jgi:tetratricopeptide (TPR) repeat protein
LSQVGRFKEAKMVLENGILNAYKFHDKFEIGHGEFSLAIQAFLEGDGNALVKHAGEAVQYWGGETATIQTGFTLSILGAGYFLRGDYETARDYAEKGLSTQRELSSDMFNAWCNIFLSFILLNEGDLIRAKECAEDCLKIAREIKARQMEAFSYGVLGCITGKADPYNIDEAQQYIQQEIMISEELKLKPQATIGYLFLGELFADAGRKKEALENLKKAELMYLELKVTPKSYWLKRMQEALAKLESIQ